MKNRKETLFKKSHLYSSIAIGVMFTLLVGSLSLYMGAQNNNQGEYYDFQTGEWDIPYAALQFAVPGIMGICIASFLFLLLHTFRYFKIRFSEIDNNLNKEGGEITYPCPGCGFLTIGEKTFGSYNICPICNWEDDQVQLANPVSGGGANKESLAEYQEKIKAKIGSEIMEYKGFRRDKNWRPLTKEEVAKAEADKAQKHWSNKGITDISEVYWVRNKIN